MEGLMRRAIEMLNVGDEAQEIHSAIETSPPDFKGLQRRVDIGNAELIVA